MFNVLCGLNMIECCLVFFLNNCKYEQGNYFMRVTL